MRNTGQLYVAYAYTLIPRSLQQTSLPLVTMCVLRVTNFINLDADALAWAPSGTLFCVNAGSAAALYRDGELDKVRRRTSIQIFHS